MPCHAPSRPCPAADAIKSRQGLYRRLGPAAARAAALGQGDAEFREGCELLRELVAAARPNSHHPQHDKAWEVVRGCEAAHLGALLCDHSAPDVRLLVAALQQHLAWSAPQAAAALLGFAGTAQAPSACPHRRLGRLAAASPDGVAALGAMLR